MNFGLSEKTLNEIVVILNKYPTIERISIFGSRAKGNFRFNSDIDLLIENEVSYSLVAQLNAAFFGFFNPI